MRVLLLGRPRLEFDGQPLARQLAAKHQAIVYFLAAQDGPVSRGELAALLWSELDESAARANLRVALTRLRQWLPGVLEIGTQQVGFAAVDVSVDLRDLQRAAEGRLEADARAAAADAWRGPLLEGFDLGSDGFERWLSATRQQAQRLAVALRRSLAGAAAQAGRTDEAIGHWRALLDIDDTDEDAHMALMRLLDASGRRIAAIAQYESCRAALADRLGARPSAACYALYAGIHADAQRPGAPAAVRSPAGSDRARPDPAGALVGRADELALLQERLRDSECRWLTIVGQGGAGKTWLAKMAAAQCAGAFRHGVLALSGRDPGGALRDAEALAQQVLERTGHDRTARGALLVLLDNLETVAGVRSLAQALHDRAPGVTVLATSRRRLGVPREWLLELEGLSLARDPADHPASSPAARLFVAAVRALDPRADLDAQADDVEALCAQVGGLPLALELAARGTADTGLRAVLSRLRSGVLHEDPARGSDERHHSMRVVLDDSWRCLPEPARAAALRLAWLPGGVDTALAEAVGVTAASMTTLREHAWLSRQGRDRLSLHPLQQDFLRRQAGAADSRAPVREALAAHQRSLLPAVAPWAAWPAAIDDAVALAERAPFGAAMIGEALEHQLHSADADAFACWVDGVVALLAAADRADEAATVLARAAARPGLAPWRPAGWTMRRAELLNSLGDAPNALNLYDAVLAPARAADDAGGQRAAWPVRRALHRRLLPQWPTQDPERTAYIGLALRSMANWTQLRSFTRQPASSIRANLWATAVATTAGTASDRWAMRQLAAYGLVMFGHARLARIALRSLRRPPGEGRDPLMEAFAAEGACAARIAVGDWAGVEDELLRCVEVLERHGDHRHAHESRSLLAKLRFYDGRLRLAYETFADCTERSLRRPGGAWRAWGPFGQAETGLCLGDVPLPQLQRLADAGSHWLTEMEGMDAAYTLRRFGLMARLACREADFARAREAVLAGVSAAARIPACGFWAHEGFSGLGDSLLELRRHERRIAGAVPPLDRAWGGLMTAIDRHVKRFPPAAALRERLRGERLFDDGLPQGVPVLRHAVALAERSGMRVELARACNVLARGEDAAAWSERAGRLWNAMGRRQT